MTVNISVPKASAGKSALPRKSVDIAIYGISTVTGTRASIAAAGSGHE